MTGLPSFDYLRERPPVILTSGLLLIAVSVLLPSMVIAGTGGVEGGCAFPKTVNGTTTYLPCNGQDLPMWYPATQNPTFSEGDLPCGTFGNQNCGMTAGAPLNE
jgi:hypothetical protein